MAGPADPKAGPPPGPPQPPTAVGTTPARTAGANGVTPEPAGPKAPGAHAAAPDCATDQDRPAPEPETAAAHPDADDLDVETLDALYAEARAAENAGAIDAAARMFAACLALDPADHCGVVMRLAKYGLAEPAAAPPAYVATLFDQHADVFDDWLVKSLRYDVPAMARARATRPIGRLLDLGCGTGLVGVAFADIAETIVGVDLAEGMLGLADSRGVYADLYVAEAVNFLAEWDETPFDAIVAADVWPYLGDLAPFAEAAFRATAPGGQLIASTERAAVGWTVTATQRFAHAPDYARSVLERASFVVDEVAPIVVRHEEGEAVQGDLLVAHRLR